MTDPIVIHRPRRDTDAVIDEIDAVCDEWRDVRRSFDVSTHCRGCGADTRMSCAPSCPIDGELPPFEVVGVVMVDVTPD